MIEIKGASFKYLGSKELSIADVNLSVSNGECVAIIGESGCGKSTLLRLINGLIPTFYLGEFYGEITINGSKIDYGGEKPIVGTVFQDPRAQFFAHDTTSELVFTCENYGMNSELIISRLKDVMDALECEELLEKSIFSLSSGEKQKIALASVVMVEPRVIVLDEPSANLDLEGIQNLKKILSLLKQRGFTIVISEHRLFYLNDIVDRIIHLKDGRVKGEYLGLNFFKREEECDYNALRNIEPFQKPICKADFDLNDNENNKYALKVKAMEFNYKKPIFESFNAVFRHGEAVAVIGENGAGKTTMSRLVSGMLKEKKGGFYFEGLKLPPRKRRKKVAMVMQDPDFQLFATSVYEELKLATGKCDNADERVVSTLEKMGLLEKRDYHPMMLSGGEKQRLTIGCAILKPVPIVIMDEPTSGLDLKNMTRVCDAICMLKKQGKCVIVITHDYEFVDRACDRVIEIKKGGIYRA